MQIMNRSEEEGEDVAWRRGAVHVEKGEEVPVVLLGLPALLFRGNSRGLLFGRNAVD
jgi:hypothetical protein